MCPSAALVLFHLFNRESKGGKGGLSERIWGIEVATEPNRAKQRHFSLIQLISDRLESRIKPYIEPAGHIYTYF